MQVEGNTPLWVAARVLLNEREEDFFKSLFRVLETYDPEDIHDLRVASRRLREGLALFSPCYPAANIVRLVKNVKGVTRLLGEIRNRDEAILFFTELADEIDQSCRGELERVSTGIQKVRKKELKRIRTALHTVGSEGMRDQFRRVTNSPCLFTSPRQDIDMFAPLLQFAAKALDERIGVVLNLLPEVRDDRDADAIHLLRIAVKHFRYRGEILSFLFGKRYEEMHDLLKRNQDLLGKIHDMDVFAVIVRSAGFPPYFESAVLEAIYLKKQKHFADFSSLLESRPLAGICEQMREVL